MLLLYQFTSVFFERGTYVLSVYTVNLLRHLTLCVPNSSNNTNMYALHLIHNLSTISAVDEGEAPVRYHELHRDGR